MIRMFHAFTATVVIVFLIVVAAMESPWLKPKPLPMPGPEGSKEPTAKVIKPQPGKDIASLPSNQDSDNDGIPDFWEIQFHHRADLAADAGSDFDHDGLTALQEYELFQQSNGLSGNPLGNWISNAIPLTDPEDVVDFTQGQITVVDINKNRSAVFRFVTQDPATQQPVTTSWIYSPTLGLYPILSYEADCDIEAFDVNDLNVVVGKSVSRIDGTTKGFIWSPGNGYSDLTVPGTGTGGVAKRINNQGNWVGFEGSSSTGWMPIAVVDGVAWHTEVDPMNGDVSNPYFADLHVLEMIGINENDQVIAAYYDSVTMTMALAVAWNGYIESEGFPNPYLDSPSPWWYHEALINNWGEFAASRMNFMLQECYLFDGTMHSIPGDHAVGITDHSMVMIDRGNTSATQPLYLWRDGVEAPLNGPFFNNSASSAALDFSGVMVTAGAQPATLVYSQLSQDEDHDGMPDDWETYYGFNRFDPSDGLLDSDGDGTNNYGEFLLHTDPGAPPILDPNGNVIDIRPGIDTDGDGIPNLWEWNHGLDYLDSSDATLDWDRDGYTNLQEFRLNTNPKGAPHYRIQELGFHAGVQSVTWNPSVLGDSNAVFTGANNTNSMVRPLVWTPQQGSTAATAGFYSAPSSPSYKIEAISPSGAVVVTSGANNSSVTYWKDAAATPITMPSSDTRSFSTVSLSPSGDWLVGWRTLNTTGQLQAFVWRMPLAANQTYVPQPLQVPSGHSISSSTAFKVNDYGHVIGNGLSGSSARGLWWSPGSGPLTATVLNPLSGGTTCNVYSLSNTSSPLLAGHGSAPGVASKTILWNASSTATDIGLPSGYSKMYYTQVSPSGNTLAATAEATNVYGNRYRLVTAHLKAGTWNFKTHGSLASAIQPLKVNDTGEVFGRITDAAGSPVRNAFWSLGSEHALATLLPPSSGYSPVSVVDMNVNGNLLVTANRDGYQARILLTSDADTDGDGLPDSFENANGLQAYVSSDGALDTDADGLTNLQEYQMGTNPRLADSDQDGMPDKWETDWGLLPNVASDASKDADGDGVSNLREYQIGTSPTGLFSVETINLAGQDNEAFVGVGVDGSIITSMTTVGGNLLPNGNTEQQSTVYYTYPPATSGGSRTRTGSYEGGTGWSYEEESESHWYTQLNVDASGVVHADTVWSLYDYSNGGSLYVNSYSILNATSEYDYSRKFWFDLIDHISNTGYFIDPVTLPPDATIPSPGGICRILWINGDLIVVDSDGNFKSQLPATNESSQAINWLAINDRGEALGTTSSQIYTWDGSTLKMMNPPDPEMDDMGGVFGDHPRLTLDGRSVIQKWSQNPDGSLRTDYFLIDTTNQKSQLICRPATGNQEPVVSYAENGFILGNGPKPWMVMRGTTVKIESLKLVGSNNRIKNLGWKEFDPKHINSKGEITAIVTLSNGTHSLVQIHSIEDSDDDGIPDDWERSVIAQLQAMGNVISNNVALFDPNRDYDGDGVSLIDEWRRGTSDGSRLNIRSGLVSFDSKDRDGDGIENKRDADPDNREIDWLKTSDPVYVLKDIAQPISSDGLNWIFQDSIGSLSMSGSAIIHRVVSDETLNLNQILCFRSDDTFEILPSAQFVPDGPNLPSGSYSYIGLLSQENVHYMYQGDDLLPDGSINAIGVFRKPDGTYFSSSIQNSLNRDVILRAFDFGVGVGEKINGGALLEDGLVYTGDLHYSLIEEGVEGTLNDSSIYVTQMGDNLDGFGGVFIDHEKNILANKDFRGFFENYLEYYSCVWLYDEGSKSYGYKKVIPDVSFGMTTLNQEIEAGYDSAGNSIQARSIIKHLVPTLSGIYASNNDEEFKKIEDGLLNKNLLSPLGITFSAWIPVQNLGSGEEFLIWGNGKIRPLKDYIVNIGDRKIVRFFKMKENGMSLVATEDDNQQIYYSLLIPVYVDPKPELHAVNPLDPSNPPYARQVKLSGIQQYDAKPQESSEIDLPDENTSIDAFSRRLKHDNSLAYVDVPSSDLDLAVKITVDNQPIEIPSPDALLQGLIDQDEFQNKMKIAIENVSLDQVGVFGAGWRSNLDGGVVCKPEFLRETPTSPSVEWPPKNPIQGYHVTVSDENGQKFKFYSKDLQTFSLSGTAMLDPDGFLVSLERTETNPSKLLLKKKFGTTTEFAWKSEPPRSLQQLNNSFRTGMWSLPIAFSANLVKCFDRYGSEVKFTNFSKRLNPATPIERIIEVPNRPDLKLTLAMKPMTGSDTGIHFDLVEQITNPRGYKVKLEYDWVDCGGAKIPVLARVIQPDGAIIKYAYGSKLEQPIGVLSPLGLNIWSVDNQVNGQNWSVSNVVQNLIDQNLSKDDEDNEYNDEKDYTSYFHVNLEEVKNPGGKITTFQWVEDVRYDTTLVWLKPETIFAEYYSGQMLAYLDAKRSEIEDFREKREWEKIDKAQIKKGALKIGEGRYVSRTRGVPDVICGVLVSSESGDDPGLEMQISQVRPPLPVPSNASSQTIPSQQVLDDFLNQLPDLAGSEELHSAGHAQDVVTTVRDGGGRETKYRFTDFHTIRIPGPAIPPPPPGQPLPPPPEPNELLFRELALCIATGYEKMEFYHDPVNDLKVTYEFNPEANYAVAKTTDLNGQITEYEYDDLLGSRKLIPNASYSDPSYPEAPPIEVFLKFGDPTAEVVHTTDGMTRRKEFRYDPNTRVMTSETDGLGNQTVYVTDTMGRTSQILSYQGLASGGQLISKKKMEYADSRFPKFVTEERVVSLPSATKPSWESDLVTSHVADGNGRVWKSIVDPGGAAMQSEKTYDKSGNMLTSKDPLGRTTSFTYDSVGRLYTVVNPDQTTKVSAYNGKGQKVREIDENGYATLFEYDSFDRVRKSARDMNGSGRIDGNDLVTQTFYNALGQLIRSVDPKGGVTFNSYDAWHRLSSTSDAEGGITQYSYDGPNCGSGLMNGAKWSPSRVINPRGFLTETSYDGLYRPKIQFAEYQLPSSPGADWRTRSLGSHAKKMTIYDLNGNPIEQRVWREASATPQITQTEYDGLNRPIATRSAVGTSLESSAQTSYTSTGLAWKTVAFQGNSQLERHTETEFDSAGRAIVSYGPDPSTGLISSASAITETHYDAASNVAYTIDPRGARTDYQYDLRNRKKKVILPAVMDVTQVGTPMVRPETTTDYDGVGNVVSVKDAYQTETVTEYDAANRAVKVTVAEGLPEEASSETTFDANGNVIAAKDGNGNITRNFYDKLNRLIASSVNPVTGNPSAQLGSPSEADIVVGYQYDAAGNQTKVADGEAVKSWNPSQGWTFDGTAGHVTQFVYDGLNRKIALIWDAGSSVAKTETSEYDALYLTARVDPKGQRTEFGYDAMGRMTECHYLSRSSDDRIYQYAGAAGGTSGPGALQAVTHPNAGSTRRDVQYELDRLDRVVSETSAGVTHLYQYDVSGNRIMVTYGGTSRKLVSSYDAQSRLNRIVETTAAVTDPLSYVPQTGDQITEYRYDALAKPVNVLLPNGMSTNRSFDRLGRTQTLQTVNAASEVISSFNYSGGYDAVGNVVAFTETSASFPARTVVNTYDRTYRLTEESSTRNFVTTKERYAYDKACNRTRKETQTGATVVFQTHVYGKPSIGNNTNQLIGVGLPGVVAPSLAAHFEITYTYDANGNRATRTKAGQTDGYSYDFDNRLVSLDKATSGSGGVYQYEYDYRTRRVVRDEPGSDDALLTFSGGTSVQEYALSGGTSSAPLVETLRGSDLGGGVGGVLYSLRSGERSFNTYNSRGDVVTTSDEAGEATWEASYEAFGKRVQEQGVNPERQRANTKDEDPTGLLNEGFRYRDLESGAFITRDPAGFVDGPNVYAYVRQNPWTKFDPEGLFWSAIVTAGFAVYDTYQYASGNISGADYAGRMALNGAALVADAATGGMGGGVAVRTAAIAARAGKVGVAAVKTAVAVDKADMAVSTAQAAISTVDAVQDGDYKRAALSAVQVGLSAKSARQQSEELADTMRPRDWSPTHSQNQKLTSQTEQSHHIVQDAAVKNQPGYSYGSAPTTKLEGGSHAPGSPHDIANKVQNNAPQGMRGTYGGERDVAYMAMRAAGQSRGTAKANLERADRYFEGELNMNRRTETDIPNED